MKRSRFDPPEYREFALDRRVLRAFANRSKKKRARGAVIAKLEPDAFLSLYAGMLRFRLFDTMLKRWVRQGVITKAWLGTGEEAVSIGAAQALRTGDAIGPMIRNAGACFEMGMAMGDHFAGYLGTTDSITGGRDIHVGDFEHGVIAPISHVGSLLPVMCGLALAFKMKREPRVALTWVGDGASRTGEIHEAVNFAAVSKLPIVIFLQNNQVALGSRNAAESNADFDTWFKGYGIEVAEVDGNNVLDVYAATRLAVDRCRSGEGPVGIVATTFRMGGHATHDEAEARRLFSEDEFAYWGKRDPIGIYEAWLIESGHLGTPRASAIRLAVVEGEIEAEVQAAADKALGRRDSHAPDPTTVSHGVFAE